MLLGVDTVKPDVHIIKFLSDTTGRKINKEEAVELLTIVAAEIGYPAVIIDNAIWNYMSRPKNREIKEQLKQMNLKELRAIQEYLEGLIKTFN